MIFKFENHSLDTEQLRFFTDGILKKIEPQVFAILSLLIQNHGRVVTKEEINTEVWGGRIISDAAVNSRIHAARIAIGDDGKTQRLIKTIPNIGFRFVGPVQSGESALASDLDAASQFATSKPPSRENLFGKPYFWIAVLCVTALTALTNWNIFSRQNSTVALPSSSITQASAPKDISLFDPSSIAVLAFADMSANNDQLFFAEGIAEEILNHLAKNNSLHVTSRTSAFALKNKEMSIPDMARTLGVRHILEGSVRKSDDDIRITVQLIDALTDTHLWSETYNIKSNVQDIFTVQNNISIETAKVFSDYLVSSNKGVARPTESIDAYEAYLRATTLRNKDSQQSLELAAEQYRLAIQTDPEFAAAYAGLALTYYTGYSLTGLSYDEVIQEMTANINKALEIAPQSVDTLIAAAALELVKEEDLKALSFANQALDVNPNHTLALKLKADAFLGVGIFKNANQFYDQALLLDPLSPRLVERSITTKIFMGDFDEAHQLAEKNLEWNPESVSSLTALAYLERNVGNYERALSLLRKAIILSPKHKFASYDLFTLYSDLNMIEQAKSVANTHGLMAMYKATVGDSAGALEIIKQRPNELDMDHAAYLAGDFALSYDLASISPQLLNDIQLLGHGESPWVAEIFFLAKSLGKPEAANLDRRLSDFFGARTPGEKLMAKDYLGAIGWNLTNGRTDEALGWLKQAVDRGFIFNNLTLTPIYAPLEDHPEYKTHADIMKKRAANIRKNLNN